MKNKTEINNKVYTINWDQINQLIELLKDKNEIFFDPIKRMYLIDDVAIEIDFFNDVISKASHLINVLSNVQLVKKTIISVDYLQKKE